jgi:hypothetical protein
MKIQVLLAGIALCFSIQANGAINPTQAVKAAEPIATSSASTSTNTEVQVLKAQLETTKQFQDAFLSMAQWTLGSTIAVALALGAFAWHTNKSNYERDREALQTEVRGLSQQLRSEIQAALEERETHIRDSVLRSIEPKIGSLRALVNRVESDTLDLKEESIEREAEEAQKEGRHRWALRKYSELISLHVHREQTQYFAAEIVDKIRAIAKDPSADLDADAVTQAIDALNQLPGAQQSAAEQIIALLKKKLG